MKNRFLVTFEVVSPESAENGEFERAGYVIPGGYEVEPKFGEETPGVEMSLLDALNLCSGPFEASSSPPRPSDWFVESDASVDYSTGEETRRSLHPPRDISPSSFKRLCRLLDVR